MKKKNILVIIAILILLGLIVGVLVLKKNSKNNTSSKDNEIKQIKALLKEDNLVKTLIYGNPKLDEAFIELDGVKYYLYNDNSIQNLDDIFKIIDKIYIKEEKATISPDVNKYNKFISSDKHLYIAPANKCNLTKFDDNLSIISEDDKKIAYKIVYAKFTATKNNDKLLLFKTPVYCEKSAS